MTSTDLLFLFNISFCLIIPVFATRGSQRAELKRKLSNYGATRGPSFEDQNK